MALPVRSLATKDARAAPESDAEAERSTRRSRKRSFVAMRMRLLWLVVLVPGCRAAGAPTYAGAAIFAGTAVGAAAVNRAVTGECWAMCSRGWQCNHKSGLCERETSPPGVKPIRRPPATPVRDAGAAADTGAPASSDAAPTDAQPDAADAQPADTGADGA